MICITSPVTLTVEPGATAPALTLRPWQDPDIPVIVAAFCDEAMDAISPCPTVDMQMAMATFPGMIMNLIFAFWIRSAGGTAARTGNVLRCQYALPPKARHC